MLRRQSREDWQWLKAFLAAVRGKQRAFWVSSYRNDLRGGAWSGLDVIIDGPSDEAGGIAAWWPDQRDRIEVRQTDGTIVYAKIYAVTDNGNGTETLSVVFSGGGPSLAPVARISWLELCRWDSDSFEISFSGGSFQFSANARVVQQ